MSEELRRLRQVVAEQDEFLKSLSEAAAIPGVVLAIEGGAMLVSSGGKMVQTNRYSRASVGATVLLNPESHQPVALSPFNFRVGSPCVIELMMPDGRVGVTRSGERRVVVISDRLPREKLEVGATGLLDESGHVMLEIMETPKVATTSEFSPVTWSQIGGNERAKRELMEAVMLIQGGSEIFLTYQAKAPKGILLSRPPGCGKTMMGRAVATELGSEGFVYIKAPELLNMYVGATEERIRGLFRSAREYRQRTGKIGVIFLDEADALLQRRGTGLSSDVDKTIVPTFLTEMDGLAESGAMMILATNRPETLDPAVVREGRIDSHVVVDRPQPPEVVEMLTIYLDGLPLADCDIETAALQTCEAIFTHQHTRSRVSGALAATVVERAKRGAIRRDIAAKVAAPSGITLADLSVAVMEGA